MTRTPEKPAGLSVWEAELFDYLSQHIENEAKLLDSYCDLAGRSGSPYVSYLLELIAQDEARHHTLFGELLNALRATVERDVGPSVPNVTPVENADEIQAETERFIGFETEDLRHLKRLAGELRPMRGLSLWPMLVETMERDTEKHLVMLRFIRDRLREDAE